MSLRVQFFLSVVSALAVSLLVLAAIACVNARRSVEVEMHKALDAGDHIVDNALLSLPAAGTDPYLARLVESFNGNRHVRVALIERGRVRATSRVAPPEAVPDWFSSWLQIPIEQRDDPVVGRGDRKLVVSSDPRNEIREVWDEFCDGALSLGLFSLLVLGLLHLVMARIQNPLNRLATGFGALGGGDYAARVRPQGPGEIARLAEAFNRMAERLSRMEAVNARMSRQMAAIQEEERAELARELHDEMGPFLFAMRVDAEGIEGAARRAGQDGIAERARAVGEAVTHIQRHVRLILKELRPADFSDFGLATAIENLAGFWRRHVESVSIELDIAPARTGFGAEADAAIYRLVQEGLTNAARHGGARHIHVTITADAEIIRVLVEDDGAGLAAGGEANGGLGLKGMRERVAGLDGELSLNAGPDGGTRLAAHIPRQRARRPEMAS